MRNFILFAEAKAELIFLEIGKDSRNFRMLIVYSSFLFCLNFKACSGKIVFYTPKLNKVPVKWCLKHIQTIQNTFNNKNTISLFCHKLRTPTEKSQKICAFWEIFNKLVCLSKLDKVVFVGIKRPTAQQYCRRKQLIYELCHNLL